MIRKFIILACIACSLPCYSWDKKGHDIVAAIAQRHLTENTRSKINELLDGKSIIYWAPWMDDASNMDEYRYTKTWHYFDTEDNEDVAESKHQESGDVLTAIPLLIDKLKSKDTTRDEKALALKFLVHLVGDMHQPMHLGLASTKGGNTTKVTFFNRESVLHSVWDGGMIARAHDWSHTEWAEEIDILSPEDVSEVQKGEIIDWARESNIIAKEIESTTDTTSNQSFKYVAKWCPTLEQQLLRAGLRLARILNSCF